MYFRHVMLQFVNSIYKSLYIVIIVVTFLKLSVTRGHATRMSVCNFR